MWSYRRVTWIHRVNPEWKKRGFFDQRMFGIKSVHEENGKIETTEINTNSTGIEIFKALKDKLDECYSKPILDLDTHKIYDESV